MRGGMTALHWAAFHRHVPSVERLLESGADPQAATHYQITPLRIASTAGDRGVVAALLRAGADPKASLPGGETPFLLASKTADLPLLRLLVELGADPLIPNADGCTPIMAAAGIGVTAVGEEAGTEPEVLRTVRFLAERALRGAGIELPGQDGGPDPAEEDRWDKPNKR